MPMRRRRTAVLLLALLLLTGVLAFEADRLLGIPAKEPLPLDAPSFIYRLRFT